MIGGQGIAQRYAKALFGLGEESGGAARLLNEVEELTETSLVMPELEKSLFTPLHPRAERRGLVAELCQKLELSRETRSFAMLLVDENRMALLPDIRDALRTQVEQAAGRVKASVTTARPLSNAQLDSLRQVLSRRADAEVTLETEIDPDLIGGVVVRLGDLLLDGSLRTQLNSLRGSLRKGSA